MDLALLADTLRIFLAPALPYLLKAVGKASEEAGKKVGGEAVEKAQEVWQKLRPAVEDRPGALTAAKDAAAAPKDEESQTVWKVQLRKILEGDEDLARAVEKMLPPREHFQARVEGDGAIAQGNRAVAAGQGGVAVGGDVHGSVIVGGSHGGDSRSDG